MDFNFDEGQLAIRESARGIFAGLVTPERVAEVERTPERIDRELWAALADGDLLGLAVPEALGGAGLGVTELCVLLEAQGRCVAPVPLWATLMLGALPLARVAPPTLAEAWLPGVVAGDVILTAALVGAAERAPDRLPIRATATTDGEWSLAGTELAVPYAHVATRIVVPASVDGGGVILVLLDPALDGITLESGETTNRELHAQVHLEDVRVGADVLIADASTGEAALGSLLEWAWVGLAALALGVTSAALAQTVTYLNEREQFGKPLSSFQATLLRTADASIDVDAIEVTLWQAAWRLDHGLDAAEAVAIAKWQASERGSRVVHATQHLHGGIGADISYPIHRYFLWGNQIELQLGGPSRQLARLGGLLGARARGAA